MTALALQHRDQIIARVAEGHMLKVIASDLDITPGAISQVLHLDPDYRQAREIGAIVRLEHQYAAIEDAQDVTAISRAREGFRAASWFAEREFPARWGQRTHVTVEQVGDLAERLRRAKERVIDPEPADTPPALTTTESGT